ncbi:signal transduction histidine kinase [Actinoplanes lutulentus]|uniref:histidine kinase n=1 Tax=Actinoplanes lutulentus TaxID=1287878 RepID=A0A327ZAC6_9ACTN|nr:HAMP domain-containing sensor histidine kinase [Actinoplanes lutulentus]MBB2946351.1 signal transduction histidine kinase [Actinoplanes lutulentus]RAK28709.1 signal transduction histidine kinase [Actinoplanes lutulentus]
MKRPEILRSIRFRLTVVYSTLLFALAALTLAVIYLAVAQSTSPQPVTERTAKVFNDNRQYLGTMTVAEVSQIEAAVNYNTLQNLRTYSLLALGGLFVASLGIGWVLSGRVLRPVGAIARTAREIQATDLNRRIRLHGPRDELRDLADTIDSMLDRLDHAFQAQRQLIDDASHELRSPLAIIRTHLDATLTAADATDDERTRAVAVVDRATIRMSSLVEDLLATARRNADAHNDTELDLTTVAHEAGEESFLPERPLHLRYRTAGGLPMTGDADGLRRAAGNLLSNAVRLAPTGSTVTLGTGRTGSWLWLAVTDQGPGIAADDLPRVFDRFWRGADGNGSARQRRTGLGLAIVRQIVESHGGQVKAFSVLGVGSTFVMWLPTPGRTGGEPVPDVNPLP